MVKIAVKSKYGMDFTEPDIFSAAYNDDPTELEAAINAGQSLDSVELRTGFTPIHIACINKGLSFLDAALRHSFNPWAVDANQRMPIDHAYAQGLRDVHAALLERMYPRPSRDTTVSPFPKREP